MVRELDDLSRWIARVRTSGAAILARQRARDPIWDAPSYLPGDLTPEEEQRIAAALVAHGVSAHCPACGGDGFAVAGYATQPLQRRPGSLYFRAGMGFPVVVTVCRRCGYTRNHAMRALNRAE